MRRLEIVSDQPTAVAIDEAEIVEGLAKSFTLRQRLIRRHIVDTPEAAIHRHQKVTRIYQGYRARHEALAQVENPNFEEVDKKGKLHSKVHDYGRQVNQGPVVRSEVVLFNRIHRLFPISTPLEKIVSDDVRHGTGGSESHPEQEVVFAPRSTDGEALEDKD